MRALRLYPQGLVLEEIARPEPGPGEVLVRVQAAAITRDELTWAGDRLPAIPSYELAGVVEASGEEVIALTPFDRDLRRPQTTRPCPRHCLLRSLPT